MFIDQRINPVKDDARPNASVHAVLGLRAAWLISLHGLQGALLECRSLIAWTSCNLRILWFLYAEAQAIATAQGQSSASAFAAASAAVPKLQQCLTGQPSDASSTIAQAAALSVANANDASTAAAEASANAKSSDPGQSAAAAQAAVKAQVSSAKAAESAAQAQSTAQSANNQLAAQEQQRLCCSVRRRCGIKGEVGCCLSIRGRSCSAGRCAGKEQG